MTTKRVICSPRGNTLSCKSWQTEAPLRMLMNNLDIEVAKDPDNLIVYGGTGHAARSWDAYDKIIESLRRLERDETLLMQSGKPVAIFRTHEWAPRVLITNSLLVPHWATWEEFWRLEAMGLTTYGQMTAGSWIYIGTQGILQGTYEVLGAVARKDFCGSLKGKWVLTAGLGEMGGAQPLAITMNDGVAIIVEINEAQIQRKIKEKYCDTIAYSLAEAIRIKDEAIRNGHAISIGLLGNAAEVFPRILRDYDLPDVVTDQTAAHDPLNGYYPMGYTFDEANELRQKYRDRYIRESLESMARHVEAMVGFQEKGVRVFEYGNNLRHFASEGGYKDAFKITGYVPAYIRDLFSIGSGPFRWAALSGDPEDIFKTDKKILETFPENEHLSKWINLAQERIKFQGLPARICWLEYGEREKMGAIFNQMVAKGELSAPIVIGRDHHDTGSVASPYRETEAMLDGSDAIADWPILNAMLNVAGGATWVSVHHGGGVGIGYSIHSGMVICADGEKITEEKIHIVLNNDPGSGVVRHADAGYEDAIKCAEVNGIDMPMLK